MGDSTQTFPKAVRRTRLLIALTAGLSLLYAIQYYLGGPLGLSVTSEIYDLALNPRGTLIAAASQDGLVRLWEVPRATAAREQEEWPVRELAGHTDAVVSVDLGPGGVTLYSAGRDGTVRVWNASSGESKAVLNVPGGSTLNAAALSADGSTLAVLGDDGLITVWEVARGQIESGADPAASIDTAGSAKRALALSPDGALVATDDGANIQIWDVDTGQAVQKLQGYWEDETEEDWLGHEKQVTVLAISPDGTLLASGGADKIVAFWDLASGEVQWTGEGHFGSITALVFDAQGKSVMSGSGDNKAKIWRIPGGKASSTFVGHQGAVNGVAFGSDQNVIVTGGGDGALRLWDRANTSETHIEWTKKGLQSVWARIFNAWMLLSGVLGLVCAWGMWKGWRWSHLLALALFIIGPIIVLGPPLLDTFFDPFSLATRLQIAWPLLVLAAWYGALVKLLRGESVSTFYEAPRDASLSEQLMASQRTRQAAQRAVYRRGLGCAAGAPLFSTAPVQSRPRFHGPFLPLHHGGVGIHRVGLRGLHRVGGGPCPVGRVGAAVQESHCQWRIWLLHLDHPWHAAVGPDLYLVPGLATIGDHPFTAGGRHPGVWASTMART